MMFDLKSHLDRITRVVEDTERDGRPAKAVIAARTFDADAANLWNAVTSPERIPRWFLPVSGDLRPGGTYQFEGNAGGTITACDPPESLAVTWEFGGGVSWLELRLGSEAGKTRLELEHVVPIDAHWEQFGPGAAGVGWDMAFMGLARHLAAPETERSPEEAAQWMASAEAMEFYRATSDAWGRAAIASGTPEAEARAAAERTRAFYSDESPAE